MHICTCECHIESTKVRHVAACCKSCGQKYIEASGEFNYRKFEAATNTCAKCEHWSPHIDDASAAEAEAANLERFAENCGYWLCNDENGRCPIVLEEPTIITHRLRVS